MNTNELWIGDKVIIKASGKEGVFEGISSDGRARVKWQNKILLTKLHNLKKVNEPKAKKTVNLPTIATKTRKRALDFNPTLDLHIEVLNPSIMNEAPQLILNHQILRCKEHIDQALSLHLSSVNIIHGKGTGQLKREVEHLIAMNDYVRFSIPQNDGGATEIWLK